MDTVRQEGGENWLRLRLITILALVFPLQQNEKEITTPADRDSAGPITYSNTEIPHVYHDYWPKHDLYDSIKSVLEDLYG